VLHSIEGPEPELRHTQQGNERPRVLAMCTIHLCSIRIHSWCISSTTRSGNGVGILLILAETAGRVVLGTKFDERVHEEDKGA
jgi:hypothetical protein